MQEALCPASTCPLCQPQIAHADLILETPYGRIVRALDTPEYPAFYRFIWRDHHAEFSMLHSAERQICMEIVALIERAMLCKLTDVGAQVKINLASLGNMVPHLHWHVIARFQGDPHFPSPIWAARSEDGNPNAAQWNFQQEILPKVTAKLDEMDTEIKILVHSYIDTLV